MALASDFEWEDKDADEINSIDSEELHETRPNRWTGPASTWRNYTQQERSTYQALEGVQSRDLSIHLYNAFALSKKIREEGGIDGLEDPNPERFASASSPSISARTSEDDDGLGEGDDGRRKRKRWQPSKKWTAWPLRANEVPSAGLMNITDDGDEHLTIRREGPSFVSRELEDEVSATILRLAKEKFLRRGLTTEPPVLELGAAGPDAMASEGPEPMVVDETEAQMVSEGRQLARDEVALDEEDLNVSVPPMHTKLSEQQPQEGKPESGVPVPSSNDELSYKLIHPSARRIIEHLDNTLNILHNSRVTGINFYSDSSADNTDEEPVAPSKSAKREKRKGKKRSSPEHDASQDEAEVEGEMKRSKGKVDKNTPWKAGAQYPRGYISEELYMKKKMRSWGLRDWRSVLGAASLAGFSPDVISRATQRCANLFGEEMTIHTFPEVPANSTLAKGKARSYKPGAVLDSADESDSNLRSRSLRRRRDRHHSLGRHTKGQQSPARTESPAESRRSKTPVDGLHVCLHPDCPRATRGFDRPSNLKRHIKEVHGGKAQPEEPTPLETHLSPSAAVPTVETSQIEGRHPCPHPTCPRARRGFDRPGNLNRHIKEVHAGKAQPEGKVTAEATPIPTIEGPVIEGKYPCPHPTCPRATHGFDRPANFNRHIKTQHAGKWKPDDPPPRSASEQSGSESDRTSQYSRSRRSTPGALHYCPYPECKRAFLGFDRRTNLMRHLELIHSETRAEHSDSDVDSMDEMDGAVHVDGFLRPIKIRRGQRGGDLSSRSPMSRTPRSMLSRASTPGPALSLQPDEDNDDSGNDDEEQETEDGDEEVQSGKEDQQDIPDEIS